MKKKIKKLVIAYFVSRIRKMLRKGKDRLFIVRHMDKELRAQGYLPVIETPSHYIENGKLQAHMCIKNIRPKWFRDILKYELGV